MRTFLYIFHALLILYISTSFADECPITVPATGLKDIQHLGTPITAMPACSNATILEGVYYTAGCTTEFSEDENTNVPIYYYEFLQFQPNGYLLNTTVACDVLSAQDCFAEIQDWFHVQTESVGKGKYCLTNKDIRFFTLTRSDSDIVRVEYLGEVTPKGLLLNYFSHATRHKDYNQLFRPLHE